MNWIIDRFEEETAVIECDGTMFNIPRRALPDSAREGDTVTLHITENKREQAKNLMNRIFDKK